MNKSPTLRVLAIDPFHGGSHRAFLNGLVEHSRHEWTLITGKPVHWKWRMRSASLEMAESAAKEIATSGYPDVILCSDMLDLPQWLGMLRDPRIIDTATTIYFHENQWTYPVAPKARIDFHFGYTNLLSALAADACWFNSSFHRDDFLYASRRFVHRMPDAHGVHDFDRLAHKCHVLPPGFQPPPTAASRFDSKCPGALHISSTRTNQDSDPDQGLTIGWVSRWEHDKRPDQLVNLLSRLDQIGVDFQLVLLGSRPAKTPQALDEIRTRFPDRILHDGFADSADQYWNWLGKMDIVVSTAEHEFFGIAVCEAVWAGAIPVLPNRLSYPELVPSECLYESLEGAVAMIQERLDREQRNQLSSICRERLQPLRIEQTTQRIDDAFQQLSTTSARNRMR